MYYKYPNKAFTLHIRLTKDCNAHCSYCSSAGLKEGRMTTKDFKTSIDWIADVFFKKLHIGKQHNLEIEYIGGEILLIPPAELKDNVEYAREKFKPIVSEIKDGAQSNLLGSDRKIDNLIDLFGKNIGTSWDTKSGQRHINGDSQLYNLLLEKSLKHMETRNINPGRVYVIDRFSIKTAEDEIHRAIRYGYDLILRPVFQGGSKVEPANIEELKEIYHKCFKIWAESDKKTRIEPFHSFFNKQSYDLGIDKTPRQGINNNACPFQSNCAFKSLSLEPDGDIYICQEMADSNNYPLGNAITGTLNNNTWKMLAKRNLMLADDCQKCQWKNLCQGGCMNEAIEHHGDPFSKTELCELWKQVFKDIDEQLLKQT